MRHQILVISTALLSTIAISPPASSKQSDWSRIGDSNGFVYELRNGSIDAAGYELDDEVSVLARAFKKETNSTVYFYQFFVTRRQCQQGHGTLVLKSLQGKVENQFDFIFSGGNIASNIAETICRAIASRDGADAAAAAADAASKQADDETAKPN